MTNHLSWQTTHFRQDLHFNITEPVTRDHLSWQTTFLWPMGVVFQHRFYCNRDPSCDQLQIASVCMYVISTPLSGISVPGHTHILQFNLHKYIPKWQWSLGVKLKNVQFWYNVAKKQKVFLLRKILCVEDITTYFHLRLLIWPFLNLFFLIIYVWDNILSLHSHHSRFTSGASNLKMAPKHQVRFIFPAGWLREPSTHIRDLSIVLQVTRDAMK